HCGVVRASKIFRWLLHTGGDFRVVLAFRGYHLDLPVSPALPHSSVPIMNSASHPKTIYLRVWGALILLLALTWGVAQFDLGPFNSVVAAGISVVKMLLVLWFFMHLRDEPRLTWIFAAAGLVWFLIMVDLTLSDYLTR